MADVGEPVREVEVEPLEIPVPAPSPEPVPERVPETVPARCCGDPGDCECP